MNQYIKKSPFPTSLLVIIYIGYYISWGPTLWIYWSTSFDVNNAPGETCVLCMSWIVWVDLHFFMQVLPLIVIIPYMEIFRCCWQSCTRFFSECSRIEKLMDLRFIKPFLLIQIYFCQKHRHDWTIFGGESQTWTF